MKYYIMLLPLLFAINGTGQTNILKIKNGNIETTDQLFFGEKILIQGEESGTVTSGTIYYSYGATEKSVKISLDGSKWSAFLEPIPPKTNIVLDIRLNRFLTESEINSIKSDLVSSIKEAINKQLDRLGTVFYKPDELKHESISSTIEKLKENYTSITVDDGMLFIVWFDTLLNKTWENDDLINLLNSQNSLNDLKNDETLTAATKVLNEKLSADSTNYSSLIKELVIMANEIESGNIEALQFDDNIGQVQSLDDSLKSERDSYLAIYNFNIKPEIESAGKYVDMKKIIDDEIDNLAKISSQQSYGITATVTAKTLGVESYLGVDVGANLINKQAATGMFVMISPYLWKIDPDKDVGLFTGRRIKLREVVTPTVGFGLGGGDLEGKNPIYFVGAGIRLNKIVRASFGGIYYKKTKKKEHKWSFGAGLSINVKHIGDFLKLTSSAQSSIQ
ncbi:MAG: hypothetical protein GY816_20540 [Cytophagales bacterium]|nr:hypothetical protein [Cytophagales bacterium]